MANRCPFTRFLLAVVAITPKYIFVVIVCDILAPCVLYVIDAPLYDLDFLFSSLNHLKWVSSLFYKHQLALFHNALLIYVFCSISLKKYYYFLWILELTLVTYWKQSTDLISIFIIIDIIHIKLLISWRLEALLYMNSHVVLWTLVLLMTSCSGAAGVFIIVLFSLQQQILCMWIT